MEMTNTQGDSTYWTSTQWANNNNKLDRELAELTENGKLLADYMDERGIGHFYYRDIWKSHLYIPILADELLDLDDWYLTFSRIGLKALDSAFENEEITWQVMGKTIGFEELQEYFWRGGYKIGMMETILIWGILYIGE